MEDNNYQQEEDRKRKGAVDRLSDSYRNVKNTQKTVRLTIKTIKQVTQAIRWFANPYFMVFAVILIIIIILSLEASPYGPTGGEAGTDEEQTTGQPNQPVPIQGLDLEISGPTAVNNGQSISYQVSISYDAAVAIIPIEDITIFHEIPQNTSFSSSSGIHENQSGIISWKLSETSNRNGFTIVLSPTADDVIIEAEVYARASFISGSGDLAGLLPPISGQSSISDTKQQEIAAQIRNNPSLISAYQEAGAATGVPWQILAGIHYKESGLNANGSLVSGRPIGENEPDIVRGGGCTSNYTPGQPVALPSGGCGFRTFADSAVYAANHFKAKNGDRVPTTHQELAKTLASYNGFPGNSNCHHGAPYPNCPARFPGDDNPYVMSYYDAMHETMYIIYCSDGTKCNPPRLDTNLGTLSVILALSRFF